MSDRVVVVVGPSTVLGPGAVDGELAAVALDCIDDDLALVDERVVPVDQLWRDVLGAALLRRRYAVVLVFPSWWSDTRVARVGSAAREWSADVIVRQRVDVLGTAPTVVEVAAELVVVHTDGQRQALPRVGAPEGVIDAIVASVGGRLDVTIDVPSGGMHFGGELSRALRRREVAVTIVDDPALARAVRAQHEPAVGPRPSTGRPLVTPRAAVLAGAVLAITALVVAALGQDGYSSQTHDTAWLVEGRVAVEVPARWTVERITSGPGSARVQLVSPSDRLSAIHLTQSRVPDDETLAVAAEMLRVALAEEPDGVFVDFTALGQRAQRPVVAYREIRAERHVDWAVLLDRGVRIAIGCQRSPDGPGPDQACDRAIRSARVVA